MSVTMLCFLTMPCVLFPCSLRGIFAVRAFHGLLSVPSAGFVRRADVKDVGYVIVSDSVYDTSATSH